MNKYFKAKTWEQKYLIVCDLDGTLLNSESEITPYTKQVIQDIIAAGHIFCIATGRPLRLSKKYYDELGLNTLIANLNGAIISSPYDEGIRDLNYVFTIDILKDLLNNQKVIENSCNFIIEDGNRIFVYNDFENQRFKKQIEEWMHTDFNKETLFIGFDRLFQEKKAINALLIHFKDKKIIDKLISAVKGKMRTLRCQIWSLNTKSYLLEVNSTFSSKENALRYFSSYYGIPLDRTIAFGDYLNDATLVKQAQYGFAMKNGKTTTKFMAYGITEYDNDHDGVAHELDNFFKNKKL